MNRDCEVDRRLIAAIVERSEQRDTSPQYQLARILIDDALDVLFDYDDLFNPASISVELSREILRFVM